MVVGFAVRWIWVVTDVGLIDVTIVFDEGEGFGILLFMMEKDLTKFDWGKAVLLVRGKGFFGGGIWVVGVFDFTIDVVFVVIFGEGFYAGMDDVFGAKDERCDD